MEISGSRSLQAVRAEEQYHVLIEHEMKKVDVRESPYLVDK